MLCPLPRHAWLGAGGFRSRGEVAFVPDLCIRAQSRGVPPAPRSGRLVNGRRWVGSAGRGLRRGERGCLVAPQGCGGVGISVQKLAYKWGRKSCWLVTQAGWAPGKHLRGQGGGRQPG